MKDVRHPTPHKTLPRLPLLVRSDGRCRRSINCFLLARECRCHAADRDGSAFEADRNQAPENVRQKIGCLDVNSETVGPDRGGIGHNKFKNASLKIPASSIQPSSIGSQGKQYLLHLVSRRE